MGNPRPVEIPPTAMISGVAAQLTVEDSHGRTEPQLRKLHVTFDRFGSRDDLDPNYENPFNDRLDWAFFKGKLRLPDSPDRLIYLFNVIVALEWTPSAIFLRKLRHGLQRASDLLYDATEGQMAFGKVTIADESWMDRADIQVMASNRILPRSWTAGLIDDEKYSPIRVGRGVWVRDRHESLDWDAANAYHTLVHEWLHYALCLRDEYLTPARPFASRQGQRPRYLVLPIGGIGSPSIMATPVGHSEFSSQALRSEDDRLLIERTYPGLDISDADESDRDPGPYRPPLAIPIFKLEGGFRDPASAYLGDVLGRSEYVALTPELKVETGDELPLVFEGVAIAQSGPGNRTPARIAVRARPDRGTTSPPLTFEAESRLHTNWEVIVLRRGNGQDGARIIAQGALDAAALSTTPPRFTLLGAREHDTVVVVGGRDRLNVYAGALTAEAILEKKLQFGEVPTSDERPFVDVAPDRVGLPQQLPNPRDVTVRPNLGGANTKGWAAIVFSRGHEGAHHTALDGQALLWRDEELLVCSYSRGGVPPTGISSPTNPLSAGSSDGGAMIFGHAVKSDGLTDYFEAINRTVVVTTSIPWLPNNDPPTILLPLTGGQRHHAVMGAARRLTNVFSIATNCPFSELDRLHPHARAEEKLNPTLMLTFEPAALREGEAVYLCRYDEGQGVNVWVALESRQVGQVVCATPLNTDTGRGLYEGNAPERYCLFALKLPEEALELPLASLSLVPLPLAPAANQA